MIQIGFDLTTGKDPEPEIAQSSYDVCFAFTTRHVGPCRVVGLAPDL